MKTPAEFVSDFSRDVYPLLLAEERKALAAAIEARDAEHNGRTALRSALTLAVEALERTLSSAEGVRWAAVNGVLGDVVINFDPDRTGADQLRQLVADVERAHDMADRARDRPIHPSDYEQIFDRLVDGVAEPLEPHSNVS